MQELSLHILDIAQNSIAAGATLTRISVREDTDARTLEIRIEDNGKGMTPEQLLAVADPFYTTRTTRRVGLGVPLLKMAAEMTGGAFSIDSEPGKGTVTRALFCTDHIDCMPLGDLEETFFALIVLNPGLDFVCTHQIDREIAELDTRSFREILGDTPLNDPEIVPFVRAYLRENAPNAARKE